MVAKKRKSRVSSKLSVKAFSQRRSLSAAVESKLLTFNQPTYTDQELEFFEDAWATTPAGTALDKRMEFVIGGGIKPIFELLDDKDLSERQKQGKLKKYDKELQSLIKFDELMNFNQVLLDASTMAKVFGRSVILFENLLDDKSVGLPKYLKLVHSRNLNKVNINAESWDIEDVKIMNPSKVAVPEEMIYIANKPNSPIRHSIWFGYSEMQRIAGAARAYRRIIEFDMPEIAQTMWAGSVMLLIKKMGRNKSNAQTDANNILNSIKPGTYNAIEVDALDEIQLEKLDLDPKIGDLVKLTDAYERIMIGNSQTPSALLGREEDQNRATLIGKIRFFIEGPVKADREWLSDIISKQWYQRVLEKMGHVDILDDVRVKAEFEPIFMESWDDLVDAVIKLDQVLPLPDDKKLELLNLEEFKDDLVVKEEEQKQIMEASINETEKKNRFYKQALSYLKKVT